MNGSESCKEDDKLRKKSKKVDSVDMDEEMIRRLYLESDPGG